MIKRFATTLYIFLGLPGLTGREPEILKGLEDVHPPTPSKFRPFPAKNGRATFFLLSVAGTLTFFILLLTPTPHHLSVPSDEVLSFCAGFALFGMIFWIWIFLTKIRPVLARWLGKMLGVTIQDRNKSTWGVVEPHRTGAAFLVALADISLLLLMSLGPFVVLTVVFLLLFQQ